ncbi:MAG: flagellin [Gemmatimonadetes bacterium]|nr:flagellin [Gemmatimonadota bacterium]MDP7365490.1 flagellin [Candidatus Latescibacterota bacterium]MDP7632504.1 flagellin [Candidatus Latescibacterota bacterium]
MPLRINNNIMAINARRNMSANFRDQGLRLERLSSGLRVNRAADDAAGLSIREGMRAELSGLRQNVLNAEQGTNLLQVAEGSLNEINAMLIRMRELSVQSASSTMNDMNREGIQAEFNHLIQEIDRVSLSTTYNDVVLLTGFGNTIDTASTVVTASNTSGVVDVAVSGASSGTYTFIDSGTDAEITLGNGVVSQTIDIGQILDTTYNVATGTSVVANFDRLGVQVTLAGDAVANATGSYVDGELDTQTLIVTAGTGGSFQVGPDDGINNRLEVNIGDMRASGPRLNLNTTSVGSLNASRASISQIDEAIDKVSGQRGDLGAVMNRLAFTISFTENSIENIQNSEASISDADIAYEVSRFTRAQVLSQASTAMFAQSNVVPQTLLSLLQ